MNHTKEKSNQEKIIFDIQNQLIYEKGRNSLLEE